MFSEVGSGFQLRLDVNSTPSNWCQLSRLTNFCALVSSFTSGSDNSNTYVLGYRLLCCCLVATSCLDTFVTPMDCSPSGSCSYGLSQQEYWSVLPFSSPGDVPDLGIKLESASHQGGPGLQENLVNDSVKHLVGHLAHRKCSVKVSHWHHGQHHVQLSSQHRQWDRYPDHGWDKRQPGTSPLDKDFCICKKWVILPLKG